MLTDFFYSIENEGEFYFFNYLFDKFLYK